MRSWRQHPLDHTGNVIFEPVKLKATPLEMCPPPENNTPVSTNAPKQSPQPIPEQTLSKIPGLFWARFYKIAGKHPGMQFAAYTHKISQYKLIKTLI